MGRKKAEFREYQGLIISHILKVMRCAIFADMGTGKSLATLTALDALLLAGEDAPVLIVAPLIVARDTWPDEVRKWEHLRDLTIAPVLGKEPDRLAALRRPANIYTINYENLVWLIKHFGDRWPFRTVVIDESRRLKSFRLRQGGKRTAALAKVAHTKITRMIHLTGAPCPNGLGDLWGSCWFLDAGHRLGRTYTAFRDRWFQKDYDGYGSTALPFAQEQIQGALSDICLRIDAADWFDLTAPIQVNRYIDLPPKVRIKYREMEKDMFTQIEDRSAEAFNAAARTQKCLQLCIAEDTEVLTEKGWTPIQHFDSSEKLWDGMAFVNADKLVCQGIQKVLCCWGVYMTPEHKVLTSMGWRKALEVYCGGFNRSKFRLPCDTAPRGLDNGALKKSDMEGALHLWKRDSSHRREPHESGAGGKEVVRVPQGGDATGSVGVARDDKTPSIPHLERHEAAVYERSGKGLEELRRAGHRGVQKVVGFFRGFLGRYGADLVHRGDNRPYRQQSGVRAPQLPLGEHSPTVEQHTPERSNTHAKRGDDSGASRRLVWAEKGNAVREIKKRVGSPRCGNNTPRREAQTFDIQDAGPRNRFVVRPPGGGIPFIVHNCNGAIYVDPLDGGEQKGPKDWKEVHDLKLQALESIIEEAGGSPVLVAYHFKSDLARLRKAFPKGLVLSDPVQMKKFKTGKYEIGFGHPASMGHGTDGLQEHCHRIAFFGHWWDLDQRDQIIGRVGPVRQFQAGHKRPVYIYNILARSTADELVLARHETKREVQDLLLEAMKRRK
jgi:hypothetical protein